MAARGVLDKSFLKTYAVLTNIYKVEDLLVLNFA